MTSSSAAGLTRRVPLHPDALDDLTDGYLYVMSQINQGWGVGLLPPTARHEDLAIAADLRRREIPVLQLTHLDLLVLHRRGAVTVSADDIRWSILVTDDDDDAAAPAA